MFGRKKQKDEEPKEEEQAKEAQEEPEDNQKPKEQEEKEEKPNPEDQDEFNLLPIDNQDVIDQYKKFVFEQFISKGEDKDKIIYGLFYAENFLKYLIKNDIGLFKINSNKKDIIENVDSLFREIMEAD